MGDTILIISIIEPNPCRLIPKANDNEEESSESNESKIYQVQKRIRADSSLREAMDAMNNIISEVNDKNTQKIWSFIDCNYHPPKPIEITASNNDYKGPNSVTLPKLGWFPSAKIIIVQKNSIEEKDVLSCKNEVIRWCDYGEQRIAESAGMQTSDETIAKPHIMIKDNQTGVLKTTNNLNPSDLLNGVTARFDNDNNDTSNDATITTNTRRTEEERCLKIDKAIEKLNSKNKKNNKNKKVNDKVRQMLIKSRAKHIDAAAKKLRPEDRIYLEVLVLHINDNDNSNDDELGYFFFSKMTSVGKIATSFLKDKNRLVELVVNMHSDGYGGNAGNRYYKLPNIMRLYEAKQNKYVNDFDRVIVRIFQNDVDSCPSIKEYNG